MPIYRLLKNSAFQPQDIDVMTAAFENICRELGLAERDDPLRDIVAKAIMECAKSGELDATKLRNCAYRAIQDP